MARTGCDFEAAISACATAPNRRRARQVLPAYGLQDLSRRKTNNRNRNISLPRNIHGGHFYMAENRTFLLCVDMQDSARFAKNGIVIEASNRGFVAPAGSGDYLFRHETVFRKRLAQSICRAPA